MPQTAGRHLLGYSLDIRGQEGEFVGAVMGDGGGGGGDHGSRV